jgi:hypothetical protein
LQPPRGPVTGPEADALGKNEYQVGFDKYRKTVDDRAPGRFPPMEDKRKPTAVDNSL